MPWETGWQFPHKLNINLSPSSASRHLPKRNKNICLRKIYKRTWVSLLSRTARVAERNLVSKNPKTKLNYKLN